MWKRFNYLVHRWIGITLGLLMASWFVSGIVLMYYPWPEPTESHQLEVLQPLPLRAGLIGFRAAAAGMPDSVVGGRLMVWAGRPVYQLWRERRRFVEPLTIVDARSGARLGPVADSDAVHAARTFVADAGGVASVRRIDLMSHGDHYMMAGEYRVNFPADRVLFADPHHTAVYVSRATGAVFGVVTSLTRLTTWTGTVPHWLYFQWLYTRPALWTWTNLILPGVAILLAMTGIILGTVQLFPRRRRGDWRVSGYHKMSKWHHITGIAFGLIVITWTLSGVLEILGPSNEPEPGQAAETRGGAILWDRIHVSELDATALLSQWLHRSVDPIAVDLTAVAGAPGYDIHLSGHVDFWVDAETGLVRGELGPDAAATVAKRVVGDTVTVRAVDRITRYDTYYYARHGREKHLPVYRVSFNDPSRSDLYLNTITGGPVGFVDADVRTWRWWRDGLHTLDFPGLNNHRPLWDLVVLPLMIGGTVSALTGVWLLGRRVKRLL